MADHLRHSQLEQVSFEFMKAGNQESIKKACTTFLRRRDQHRALLERKRAELKSRLKVIDFELSRLH